ncbi:UDP-2,4-diacetamido-2,4,6-trideoxy-beta-L-altropyranose hydrolase [Halobacterium salinarum]|uniref:UDP-2,4-diacetamido-2,4, 6-trideoxy-beta-L-altropyranose hydrolase n=1 Tax=Halobacterium salinarum TaxID=2242 RepID=UPI002557201A|nr:UDP-2,4-diacetamido-2,4,6-trideoxy-beta-L-altropyranose hydrolase [Halobacterium salinarum]MDL0119332.1 UDP-2,4-diacetamido-2,4,6-trideoxy-beta-L-altropyranose hydrolase [Halobacterium salinarum]
MHVAIRADGGPEIGYGHLIRTGALASRLLRRSHRVTYVTTTSKYVDDVAPSDVETKELPSRTDVTPLVKWLDGSDVDVVVVDSYLADAGYQRSIRDLKPLVLVSDDTRHPVCADAVVNGNIYAPRLDYGIRGGRPRWFLGPNYVLLRQEITQLADQTPRWRNSPNRAIITMGGSDVTNSTPDAVQAFDGTGLRLDVVVGPGFTNENEIRTVADNVTADTHVVQVPQNLPELMFKADFAVGACGSTTYELLALGTPLVCSPVVENQERIASALSKREIAIVVEETDRKEGFRRGVTRYLEHSNFRRERQDRGRNIIDGHGTERVCAELLSIAGNKTVS